MENDIKHVQAQFDKGLITSEEYVNKMMDIFVRVYGQDFPFDKFYIALGAE
jgi:hypothetical protein